jgi:NAD(P)-dependent dehydrogenase (short-subunit alcohol dehydrogenase family)
MTFDPSQNATLFTDQVVVVIGASNGIGRAAASLISHRGAKVIIADMNPDGLKELAAELKLATNQVHVLDVSDQIAVTNVITSIIKDHGKIDALVNSAGIVGQSNVKVEDLDWALYEKTLQVNLYGAIWLTQQIIPHMKKQAYGRIVHLASIAGKEGNPGMAPYNTSKAGLIGFVKGVAKELAPAGIIINALAPAVISTPMNSNTSEETLKYMISRIPLGRTGQASEVAEIIAFMASPACSFTTGFTFDISGGRATY